MNPAFGWFLFRDPRTAFVLLAAALVPFLPGCASLPDVTPFTEATASLRSAVASAGAATVAELGRVNLTDAKTQTDAKAEATTLAADWTARDRVFTSLATYANSLQAIVDSGQSGAAAAQAVADAATQLATAANIIQPGAGPATAAVTETAAFVYQQIAKARAVKSLEKALADVQPAIERVAQFVSADMKDLDAIIRVAAKAQADALKIDNESRLSYREQLVRKRDVLMKQVNAALGDDKKVTDLADASELKRVDELLADANAWHLPLEAQLKEIAAREKVARQLIAETQGALQDWATAHGQLLIAVRTKHPPSVAELSESAKRIRELVQKFRSL